MRTDIKLGISPIPWIFVRSPIVNRKTRCQYHDPFGCPLEAYHVGCCGDISFVAKNLTRPDAHLIAAAPALYEALRKLVAALQNRLPKEPTHNEAELVISAYRALAKASGESEAA